MRILLWHGWLLEGTGSNIYTARTAEVFRRQGHEVLLLCQESHPRSYPWIDAAGEVGPEGVTGLRQLEAAPEAGSVVLLRPRIGDLLPVFVLDEYERFEVKRFVDLSDAELAAYIQSNVDALRATAAWRPPDVVVAGHAVPGPVVARRALGEGRYVAKVHGSDLEYAVRLDPRCLDLAREGLTGATAVIGASRDVLRRAAELVPATADRLVVVQPGVDVHLFQPAPRRAALESTAAELQTESARADGRPSALDDEVGGALAARDGDAIADLAGSYDQTVPDQDAPERLAALAGHEGPLIGYLGKLIPQKGVELLLQALPSLGEDVACLVIGFGRGREWLTALLLAMDPGDPAAQAWLAEASPLTPVEETIRAPGLRARVVFTGRLDHRFASKALAALDVLVVPSILDEAFGMVVVEGAAAGALPMVARHSGLAEIADALEAAVERPGLFSFEPGPGAAGALAKALGRLLDLGAVELQRLRRTLSEQVRTRWTWERTASRLLSAATGPPPGSG